MMFKTWREMRLEVRMDVKHRRQNQIHGTDHEDEKVSQDMVLPRKHRGFAICRALMIVLTFLL